MWSALTPPPFLWAVRPHCSMSHWFQHCNISVITLIWYLRITKKLVQMLHTLGITIYCITIVTTLKQGGMCNSNAWNEKCI
jgi:hypothetical protein